MSKSRDERDDDDGTSLLLVTAWQEGGKTRAGAAAWLRRAAAWSRSHADKLDAMAAAYEDAAPQSPA